MGPGTRSGLCCWELEGWWGRQDDAPTLDICFLACRISHERLIEIAYCELYVDLFSPDSFILKHNCKTKLKSGSPKVFCFGFAFCATLLPYFWHLATWRFPSLHEVLRFIVGGGQWLKDSWNVGEEEDGMYTCSVWTKNYFWSRQLENIHPISAILVLQDLRFATVQNLLKESDTWRQSGTHWKMTAVGVSGMSELENCILHILHYIVLHCLYISVVSKSKILSKDLWRNY